MALITRFARILSADLHAVLDRLEEPDTLLKQAIREMHDELDALRAQAAGMSADTSRNTELSSEAQTKIHDYNAQLDLCFKAGEETLARNLLRRKLETERLLRSLTQQAEKRAQCFETLSANIYANECELASMEQKATILAEAADLRTGNDCAISSVSISAEELDAAFLQEKQRRAAS